MTTPLRSSPSPAPQGDPAAGKTPLRATDPALIGAALGTLAQGRQALSIYLGADLPPAEAPVAGVNLAAHTFQLDCTYAPDAAALLAERGIKRCVALSEGVRMQFAIDQAVALPPGRPGLVTVPFPRELYQIGRRTFVRLTPPPERPWLVRCQLDGREVILAVQDLSMGGLALRTHPDNEPLLRPGRVLHGIGVTVGGGREVHVSIEIRLVRRVVVRGAGPQLHLGCRFVNLNPAQRDALAEEMAMLGRRYRGK